MNRLIFGHDAEIAAWAFRTFQRIPTPCVMAIGIIDPAGAVKGAVLFQEWNGCNIELSWFGPNTVTRGILRQVMTVVLDKFNVQRVTVRTMRRNKALVRSLPKLGWKYEGMMPGFYGPARGDAAVVFGLYRDGIARLAGRK